MSVMKRQRMRRRIRSLRYRLRQPQQRNKPQQRRLRRPSRRRSRMVTLKDAVERNLGSCAAAVVAKNGSRHEWLHDTGIPQADKIIGKGSRVVINMGVNDLSDADKYAKDVNYWAAVWSARGAQIYYASVNPVWANSYGMTEERVKLFNDRLKGQLIPQIIWLDSHDYLMGVGVHASDGVHYKDDTNLVLYQYYLSMIGAV